LRILVRETETPATAVELEAMRRDLVNLGHQIREAADSRQHLQSLYETAENVLRQAKGTDHNRIENVRNKRFRNFVKIDHRCESLVMARTELERRMQDGHAYFARAEVVNFCKSRQ
jgi:hypothetical protein